MLCCVGLIGGMAVGQSMGGPWTYIAPAAGFGIGLIGDMKFMKGMHGSGKRHDATPPATSYPDQALAETPVGRDQAPQQAR